MIGVLHLRHAETAAVGCRLYETRHSDKALYLLVAVLVFLAATQQQAICHVHSVTFQIVVEHILVECHRLDEHTARAVWHLHELEIALHQSVLSRCAVYCYVGIVEHNSLSVLYKREVVAVDGSGRAVLKVDMPVRSFHVNDIHIVTFLVEERIKPLCRIHRHVVLRRVATAYDGYVSLYIFHIIENVVY